MCELKRPNLFSVYSETNYLIIWEFPLSFSLPSLFILVAWLPRYQSCCSSALRRSVLLPVLGAHGSEPAGCTTANTGPQIISGKCGQIPKANALLQKQRWMATLEFSPNWVLFVQPFQIVFTTSENAQSLEVTQKKEAVCYFSLLLSGKSGDLNKNVLYG